MNKYQWIKFKNCIVSIISLSIILCLCSSAQELKRPLGHKKSHLKPVEMSLASLSAQKITETPKISVHSPKSHLRKNKQINAAPLMKVFDPAVISGYTVADSKPAQQKQRATPAATSTTGIFSLLAIASMVAFAGTSMLLSLIKKVLTKRQTIHPVHALEIQPKSAIAILHSETPVLYSKENEERENVSSVDPEPNTSLEYRKGHGEIELAIALQGLKLKQEMNRPHANVIMKKSSQGRYAEAKQMGIGLGELELARRLDRFTKQRQLQGERL